MRFGRNRQGADGRRTGRACAQGCALALRGGAVALVHAGANGRRAGAGRSRLPLLQSGYRHALLYDRRGRTRPGHWHLPSVRLRGPGIRGLCDRGSRVAACLPILQHGDRNAFLYHRCGRARPRPRHVAAVRLRRRGLLRDARCRRRCADRTVPLLQQHDGRPLLHDFGGRTRSRARDAAAVRVRGRGVLRLQRGRPAGAASRRGGARRLSLPAAGVLWRHARNARAHQGDWRACISRRTVRRTGQRLSGRGVRLPVARRIRRLFVQRAARRRGLCVRDQPADAVQDTQPVLRQRADQARPVAAACRVDAVAILRHLGDEGSGHGSRVRAGALPPDAVQWRVRQLRGPVAQRRAVAADGPLPRHGGQRQGEYGRRHRAQPELRARTAAAVLDRHPGTAARRHAVAGRREPADPELRTERDQGVRARVHGLDLSAIRRGAAERPGRLPLLREADGHRGSGPRCRSQDAAQGRHASRRPCRPTSSCASPSTTCSCTRTPARSSRSTWSGSW